MCKKNGVIVKNLCITLYICYETPFATKKKLFGIFRNILWAEKIFTNIYQPLSILLVQFNKRKKKKTNKFETIIKKDK